MTTVKKKTAKSKKTKSAVTFTKGLDEVPTCYANNTNMTVSPYDFRITFSQIVEVTDAGMIIEPKAVVFMSPQHAKAVSELLASQIKLYEENTGQPLSDLVAAESLI